MGCTIGAVCAPDGLVVFKNCDLAIRTLFYKPKLIKQGGFRRIELRREGRPGPWAGLNEHGLGLVAADFHSVDDSRYSLPEDEINGIFRCYGNILAQCATVKESKELLDAHYKHVSAPDIVLVASPAGAAAAEFMPEHGWRFEEAAGQKFLLRTNTPRNFPEYAKPIEKDPGSWSRQDRATELLRQGLSAEGVMKLCRDHQNGPGDMSVCRHGSERTQASAIMVAGTKTGVWYIINAHPCEAEYEWIEL